MTYNGSSRIVGRKFRLSLSKLEHILKKAVEDYNRIRAPEAVAKITKIEDDLVYVEFDGTYCETCGLYDWIEDFKYVLEDLGVNNELVNVIEPEGAHSTRRIGVFKVEDLKHKRKAIRVRPG